jgi:hypothetical protein
MNIRYKSKKDAWLVVIIAIAFLISFLSLILTIITPGAFQQGGWVSVVVVVVVWAFIASLIWPLYCQ